MTKELVLGEAMVPMDEGAVPLEEPEESIDAKDVQNQSLSWSMSMSSMTI